MSVVTDTEPAVYIACLACYNAGRLTGKWYPAIEASEVTVAQIHWDHEPTEPGHEELWCLDSQNMLTDAEMSPVTATKQAEVLEEVSEYERDALRAWVESGMHSEDVDGMPSTTDFYDSYRGNYDSFKDYAEEFVFETGMLDRVPEEITRYFDYDAFARDLAYDYTVMDAPEGGVFVFANL